MLTELTLQNFKCFENESFPLRALTMLTGLNSTGKSTVLQAMLLLRQSHEDRILENTGLTLDGPLVQLGTARDVLFEGAKEESIEFGVRWDDGMQATFVFGYDQATDVLTFLNSDIKGMFTAQSLFTDRFHYLEAERIGPRSAFEMSEFEVHRHRQLGTSGEYTAHFMALFGSELNVSPAMRHPNANSPSLRDQVEAWMSEISPGLRLHFNAHRTMDLVNLGVSFTAVGIVSTNEYRSANVGFGITYTLPIVVSLLSSNKGDLVFLENPEAHLHPRAQSKIGELITRACSSGVQVIFETHSDHVLNGVRIAVKAGVLNANDATVLFFDKDKVGDRLKTQVSTLLIDSDGRIANWPVGFFDEFEKSIERLM
jgi:predicted ATPase